MSLVERARIRRNLDEAQLARGAGAAPPAGGSRHAPCATGSRTPGVGGPPRAPVARPRRASRPAPEREEPRRRPGPRPPPARAARRCAGPSTSSSATGRSRSPPILLATLLYAGLIVSASADTFGGRIPIQVLNQPEQTFVLGSLDDVTSVRYIAVGTDRPAVTSSSFTATIDLADVEAVAGAPPVSVPVVVRAVDPRIQVVDFSPSRVAVRLDPLVTKDVPVRVDLGTVPPGLDVREPVVSQESVAVSGPGFGGPLRHRRARPGPHRPLRPRRQRDGRPARRSTPAARSSTELTSSRAPCGSRSRSAASWRPGRCRCARS